MSSFELIHIPVVSPFLLSSFLWYEHTTFFLCFPFLLNLLEWHWLTKLYRFQVYNSTTHWIDPFVIRECYLSFTIDLVYFVGYKYCYLIFLKFHFHKCLFPSLYLYSVCLLIWLRSLIYSICMELDFLFSSPSLWFGAFNPFTIEVIINRYLVIVTLFYFLCVQLLPFNYSYSFFYFLFLKKSL